MLNQTDIINLLNLLKRSTYNGLEEAQVGIALAEKLSTQLKALNELDKEKPNDVS